MAKSGSVALGLEIGEGGRLEQSVTEQGLRGLRNILRAAGLLGSEQENFGRKLVITDMIPVRAHRGGLMHLHVRLNEDVTKGQVVATITNLFGEVVEEITAPFEGPSSGLRRFPSFPPASASSS